MTEQAVPYSVFLSFNSEDVDIVEKIAIYLIDIAKLKPWIDRWEMIPGESSMKQIERGLQTCQTCAVFVGSSGRGPWQEKEVETALRQQIGSKEFRVIPVLLPGAPEKVELPSFLANNVWIDFRQGLENDHALWLLECGILGKSPGRGRPKTGQLPTIESTNNKENTSVQTKTDMTEIPPDEWDFAETLTIPNWIKKLFEVNQ